MVKKYLFVQNNTSIQHFFYIFSIFLFFIEYRPSLYRIERVRNCDASYINNYQFILRLNCDAKVQAPFTKHMSGNHMTRESKHSGCWAFLLLHTKYGIPLLDSDGSLSISLNGLSFQVF